MEDSLGQVNNNNGEQPQGQVLILVVMEDSLGRCLTTTIRHL